MKNKRVQIGSVGVDSGQLMVCDPCYITSQWKETRELDVGSTQIFDKETGLVWLCSLHTVPGSDNAGRFGHYDSPIESCGGLTPNQLIERGRWLVQKRNMPGEGEFSYQGCCTATCNEPHAGELENGAGVAFSSGWGDGVYPVFATYNKEGRIVKVEIIME